MVDIATIKHGIINRGEHSDVMPPQSTGDTHTTMRAIYQFSLHSFGTHLGLAFARMNNQGVPLKDGPDDLVLSVVSDPCQLQVRVTHSGTSDETLDQAIHQTSYNQMSDIQFAAPKLENILLAKTKKGIPLWRRHASPAALTTPRKKSCE